MLGGRGKHNRSISHITDLTVAETQEFDVTVMIFLCTGDKIRLTRTLNLTHSNTITRI
jgi:hypothetical protein